MPRHGHLPAHSRNSKGCSKGVLKGRGGCCVQVLDLGRMGRAVLNQGCSNIGLGTTGFKKHSGDSSYSGDSSGGIDGRLGLTNWDREWA